MKITVNIEEDEDGDFVVTVPEMPWVLTHGATIEEAILMACDAITAVVEHMIERGVAFNEDHT